MDAAQLQHAPSTTQGPEAPPPPPPPPPQSALAVSSARAAPELPARPDGMSIDDPTQTAYGTSLPMQNPAMSSFSNRYAGYGGYGGGGMYGGGMGSYGGGYGSNYGSSYGGYNRFGAATGGMYGTDPYGNVLGPGGNPTWSSQLQNQTMPAFAVLESLVTAFSSLAQLFESTYAATHSSFFAMVGVADQLGGLKSYLGQVLGLFSVVRLGRKLVAWLRGHTTGPASPAAGSGGWAEEWKIGQALDRSSRHPSSSPSSGGGGGGKPSAKPLLWFLVSAIGLPYLMTKLVRLLTELQRRRMELAGASGAAGHNPALGPLPTTAASSTSSTAPSNSLTGPSSSGAQPLLFARTIWPFEGTSAHELTLKRDEIVAVLQRLPAPAASATSTTTTTTTSGGETAGWWRGRTRDGRVGWFPGNYVEPLRRKEEAQLATPPQDTKGAGDSFVGA